MKETHAQERRRAALQVKGVQDAGFLKSADWSLDGVLTVELTADKIYGEIASASKLAIMWKLKSPLTFAVKPGEYAQTPQPTGLTCR